MRVNYNQFLAVIYGDIFDWPLTRSELSDWQIKSKSRESKQVEHAYGHFFLPGREKLVKARLVREKISARKKIMAEAVAGFLAKIPTIEAIFLTGSAAIGGAKKGSDIDLLIVTAPNALWITRMIVVVLLKALRSYGNGRDRVCPNIFLDANHLEIKEKNLYAAHEVLQARCLFDRGGVEKKWLTKNRWTKEYLPSAYWSVLADKNARLRPRFARFPTCAFWPLEPFAFVGQYLYQLPKQTNERVGWGYAFFHPRKLGPRVENKFNQRLVKYSNR